MVEDEGRREVQAGGGAELVAQLDRGEGVEAELLERLTGRDGVGAGVAEDRGGVRLDQPQQELLSLRGRAAGQLPAERRGRAVRRRSGPRRVPRRCLAMSAISGLGRCVVKAAGNLSQSMSATVMAVSPWSRA